MTRLVTVTGYDAAEHGVRLLRNFLGEQRGQKTERALPGPSRVCHPLMPRESEKQKAPDRRHRLCAPGPPRRF